MALIAGQSLFEADRVASGAGRSANGQVADCTQAGPGIRVPLLVVSGHSLVLVVAVVLVIVRSPPQQLAIFLVTRLPDAAARVLTVRFLKSQHNVFFFATSISTAIRGYAKMSVCFFFLTHALSWCLNASSSLLDSRSIITAVQFTLLPLGSSKFNSTRLSSRQDDRLASHKEFHVARICPRVAAQGSAVKLSQCTKNSAADIRALGLLLFRDKFFVCRENLTSRAVKGRCVEISGVWPTFGTCWQWRKKQKLPESRGVAADEGRSSVARELGAFS